MVVLMKATTVIVPNLLGFSDGIELGLRLGTREGVRLGVPLGLSDGIELGMRLGTSIIFTHRTHIIYRPVTIQ